MGNQKEMKQASDHSNSNEILPFSGLPRLFKLLTEEVTQFVDLKLTLFQKELWQEGQVLVGHSLGIVGAIVVAITGFQVLIAASALALSLWLDSLLFALLITGTTCLLGGALGAIFLARRLRNVGLPKSRNELIKDKEWIQTQTSRS
jgi:hypothetical protein